MRVSLVLFLALRCCFSFSQEWDWTKIAGGPAIDKITGVAVDISGNIFIAGYFDSTIAFDSTRLISSGGTDIFIAKYDADGVLLWAKQVGGQNDDYSSAISTDIAGNCYITGFFFIQGISSTFGNTTITEAGDADMFVSKFSAGGNLLWVRNAGGRNDDGSYGIASDISGNSYITGYFSGIAYFGTTKISSIGYTDIFIAKYDAAGNLVWVKTGGGPYQDMAYGISTDITGNCYVTGFFTGNANFSGTTLWSSGYFDTDVFVLKYNPSGILVWAKRSGGTGNDFGYGISVAKNGQIYVAGTFKGTKSFGDNILTRITGSNGFISQFDVNGKLSWTKGTNGSELNEFTKVSTDVAGNCYVSGYISGEVSIGSLSLKGIGKDACVAKFDSKGVLMWALQGGGENDDEAMCVSSDASGNCYIVGEFTNVANFGRLKFSGWGLRDLFISKIK